MGCHTWFYRKIERTQEEAKQSCLQNLKRSRNLAWKIYKNPTSYYGINWETTKEEQLYYIKYLNRQIRMVSNNLCSRAVWDRQNDEDLTEYIEGKGLYIEDTGFHDVFRKYGYPDDKLFSLQETLNYINNPENACVTYDKTFERLNEFWNKYPDGMIEFG